MVSRSSRPIRSRDVITSVCCMLLALAGTVGSSQAEGPSVQLGVGGQFPLVSERFEVNNSLGYHVRIDFLVGERFMIGGVFETNSTEDDLGNNADVDQTMYGLEGTYFISDEAEYQLYLLLGVGSGDLDYQNPAPIPGIPDETDLFWFEGGGGVQFDLGRRWFGRTQITFRRVDPDQPMVLIDNTRTVIVPAFTFAVRF